MKIYSLHTNKDYQGFISKNGTLDLIEMLDGESLIGRYQTLELTSSPKSKKKGDIRSIVPSLPTINEKALSILSSLISQNIEALDIITDDKKKFYLINVLNIIDCVDYKKSLPIRVGNTITHFEKYFFYEEKVKNENIFKTPEEMQTMIFVSDNFKETVEKNNLKGFCFKEEWDSEKD